MPAINCRQKNRPRASPQRPDHRHFRRARYPGGLLRAVREGQRGTLSNLRLDKVSLYSAWNNPNFDFQYSYTGALAGYSEGSSISGYSSSGTVNSNNNSQGTGGLIGYFLSAGGKDISGCSSACAISGYLQVGGLAGFYELINAAGSDSRLSGCYASGAVNGSANIVGGLLGCTTVYQNNSIAISNCYATGDAAAITWPYSSSYAGGLLGYVQVITAGGAAMGSCPVSNCYASGNVSGPMSSPSTAPSAMPTCKALPLAPAASVLIRVPPATARRWRPERSVWISPRPCPIPRP
ncbi:MAG: hypothetical protein ABFD18_13710 [Syntrophomonas sp.]